MHKQEISVNPSVYTKEYYLSDCTGFKEFKESYGDKLETRFLEVIKYFKVNPGTRVLDIGCGRGELVFFAARQGAQCIGIDYSVEAIKLAQLARSKKNKALRGSVKFYVMDAKKIRFRKNTFDIVILTDVVEHLYDHELKIVFQKIKNVLKRSGILIVHSAPNRIFNDFAYKYYCYPLSSFLVFAWNLFFKKKYPNIAMYSDLRTDSHARMHINEPTYFSLWKLFRENMFKGKIFSSNITVKKPLLSIKDYVFNFLVFLDPISRLFPLNILFGSDFICVLKNNK